MNVEKVKETAKRIGKDIKCCAWAGAAFVIYYVVIHAIFDAFCPLLVMTGIPCAGCGLTRAVLYLLKGQIGRAFGLNPSIFPILLFLLYCGYFRYLRGTRIKGFRYALAALVAVVLMIYCCRMILYFPDRAPYVYHRKNILAELFPLYGEWMKQLLQNIRAWRGA